MADLPATDAVAYAVTYTFGAERAYYERARTVWDLPVVFRVLSTADAQAADLAADRLASAAASSLERGMQCLARSIVSIDGQEYGGRYAPGDESAEGLAVLDRRLRHLHGLPALLVSECYAKFTEVANEYAALLGGDRLGESSPVAGNSGAS